MALAAENPGRIAIVGGGAAGALLALQLAARGIASTIFDRNGAFGRGVAYSAAAPWHRLNVPIEKMGGWAADDTDVAFEKWYVARFGEFSNIFSDRFVARSVYGAWLSEELERVSATGSIELRQANVIAVAERPGSVAVELADGETVSAPVLVLCLGNHPPRPLPIAATSRVVGDLWAAGAMSAIAAEASVLIVGTGATGIDALLDLHHRGHTGPIHMLSRRGLMPLEDMPAPKYSLQNPICFQRPQLSLLIDTLRHEARLAAARGIPWHSVVDAFRLEMPRLWRCLSLADRQRFVRHLRAYWLIHRHRLSPDIAELLRRLQAEGRFTVLQGTIRSTECRGDGLIANISTRHGGAMTLEVGWVINCTGPSDDFRRMKGPLEHQLMETGVARPGPFGIGLDVDDDGRLVGGDGTAHSRLLVLGGATWPQFGEVTSAPQIRRKAAHLTDVIAGTLNGTS